MSHLAFQSVPLHGHVVPSLPVVAELVRRGHRVTYATTEEFAARVEKAGATPLLYETTFPSAGGPAQNAPRDDSGGALTFLNEAIAVLPQLESGAADLVVHDICAFQGPVLAKRWGVPAVQLSPSHVAPGGVRQILGAAEPPPGLAEFEAALGRFSAGSRLRPEEVMASPRRCVVTIPRAFQANVAGIDDRYTFVGPMLPATASKPVEHPPTLLISLGSTFLPQRDFYRTCVEAFRDTDWHVVMAVGWFVSADDLESLPPNCEAHQWIPLEEVLPRTTVFVTHAGMGSTMLALQHEVPLVAVPQMAGQPLTGRRLAELGLGRHLPRDRVTADSLRDAVTQVAHDEEVASKLRWMRREIDESGGAALAADVIESDLPQ